MGRRGTRLDPIQRAGTRPGGVVRSKEVVSGIRHKKKREMYGKRHRNIGVSGLVTNCLPTGVSKE